MSLRVDPKDIVIHLSPDGTTVEGITPNDLALIERQTAFTIIDIEEEIRRITADAVQIHADIAGLVIHSDADLQTMNMLMNRAKDKVKEAETLTKPVRSFLDNLHAKACNVGAGSIKTLKEDVKFADGRMKDYARQQKVAVDDARRISDAAIAKENAERERAALEDNAANQREADRLRELGQIREAKVLAAVPAVAPVAMPQVQVIVQPAPRLSGTAVKYPYTAVLKDKMALIKMIADGRAPLTYTTRGKAEDIIEINETLLRALATQKQDDLKLDGVDVFPDVQFSRSRK